MTLTSYVRSDRAPLSCSPALNVLVAVTGRRVIVTTTFSSPTGMTPLGRSNPTDSVTLLEAPVTGTGRVSTRTSAASLSASPWTRTASGLTVIDAISNPAAGVPVTTGLTGSDLLCLSVNTGIVTWVVDGVEVDRSHGVAVAIDRRQLELLVDIDAVGPDLDVSPRPHDLAPSTAHVTVPVYTDKTTKSLPVNPVVTGTPAAGFEIAAIAVKPETVTVQGEAEKLGALDRVDTLPVPVTGASNSVTESVGLDLPTGIIPVGDAKVVVTISLRPVTARERSVSASDSRARDPTSHTM